MGFLQALRFLFSRPILTEQRCKTNDICKRTTSGSHDWWLSFFRHHYSWVHYSPSAVMSLGTNLIRLVDVRVWYAHKMDYIIWINLSCACLFRIHHHNIMVAMGVLSVFLSMFLVVELHELIFSNYCPVYTWY